MASNLREEIRTTGSKPLPSERDLAQRLQVSRRTIRKALLILRSEGLVKTTSRHSVALHKTTKREGLSRPEQINLLLPEPIEQARPFTALWIRCLTELLHENGCRLEIITGEKYYGLRSGKSLTGLVESRPARCWLLARSNRPLQQWFNDRTVPSIVAGSTHPGISLPSIDTDHGALSHHAAGQFLRHGHTRVALFFEKIRHAGDDETELGFAAGMASSPRAEPLVISRAERRPDDVIREVKRLLALRSPPTGFLFCNSFAYLTVLSYLATLGRRIPQDYSAISQDEGPFLSHLYPSPARYLTNPRKFATALNRAIKHVLDNDMPEGFKLRIMPDFIQGGSVAAARSIQ